MSKKLIVLLSALIVAALLVTAAFATNVLRPAEATNAKVEAPVVGGGCASCDNCSSKAAKSGDGC